MIQELTTKQSFWLGHIQAAHSSGLSFVDYASKHEINVKSLYNWALVLRRKGAFEQNENAFVELKLDTSPKATRSALPNHQPVQIFLPNGVRIELPEFNQSAIAWFATL